MKKNTLILTCILSLSMLALISNVSARPLKTDLNNDGTVNICDLLLQTNYYGARRKDTNWKEAKTFDINKDGIIDILDIVILLNDYGKKH